MVAKDIPLAHAQEIDPVETTDLQTRILLVEDNPSDSRLITTYLSSVADRSYICDVTENLAGARQYLSKNAEIYDAVLVDENLPDGSGVDLIGEFSGQIHAPIILLTGQLNKEMDQAAIQAGASYYLPKDDADSEVLDRVIRYTITERDNRQSLRSSVDQLLEQKRSLEKAALRRDAEVTNVIKLTEHLSRPLEDLEFNCHFLGKDQSGYSVVADASNVGIWQIQPTGETIHANTYIQFLFGENAGDEASLDEFTKHFPGEASDSAVKELARWNAGMVTSFEAQLPSNHSLEIRDLAISGCPMLNSDGSVDSILVTVVDITERRRAESAIRDLAQKDQLTGLLNRATFMEILPGVVAMNRRNDTSVALLYLDLDKFKAVNDTLGHNAGDQVLVTAAKKLRACIRESDFVARLGGDEFTVILNNLKTPLEASAVCEKLLEAFGKPWLIGDALVEIGVSIGIAIYENEEHEPEQVLKNADLALYRCKQSGGNAYQFFDPAMLESVKVRVACELDLAKAIADDRFEMHYQRQVDLRTGELLGLEALLRWDRPNQGLVGPAVFMNVAESSPLICDIGSWVAHAVCQDISRYPMNVPVAINVSAREFHQRSFADSLAGIVRDSGHNPEEISVEITESAVFADLDESREIVRRIRNHGIGVALDDFGTGFSSLSLIRELSVSCLKIDGSFMRDVCTNATDRAIVETIIDLAHRMNLDVVAEYIESEDQAALMRELGCIKGQGYLFGAPMKPAEILERDGLLKTA